MRWGFPVCSPKLVGYLSVLVIDWPCFSEPAVQLSSKPRAKPLAPTNSKLGWFINRTDRGVRTNSYLSDVDWVNPRKGTLENMTEKEKKRRYTFAAKHQSVSRAYWKWGISTLKLWKLNWAETECCSETELLDSILHLLPNQTRQMAQRGRILEGGVPSTQVLAHCWFPV